MPSTLSARELQIPKPNRKAADWRRWFNANREHFQAWRRAYRASLVAAGLTVHGKPRKRPYRKRAPS